MATLAELQTRLAEAEAAHHKLVIGAQEVTVHIGTPNSEQRVTYAQAQASVLAAYIDGLKAQIAAAGGTVEGSRRRALEADL